MLPHFPNLEPRIAMRGVYSAPSAEAWKSGVLSPWRLERQAHFLRRAADRLAERQTDWVVCPFEVIADISKPYLSTPVIFAEVISLRSNVKRPCSRVFTMASAWSAFICAMYAGGFRRTEGIRFGSPPVCSIGCIESTSGHSPQCSGRNPHAASRTRNRGSPA